MGALVAYQVSECTCTCTCIFCEGVLRCMFLYSAAYMYIFLVWISMYTRVYIAITHTHSAVRPNTLCTLYTYVHVHLPIGTCILNFYLSGCMYAGMTTGFPQQPHHSIETADSESLSSYDRDSIHSTSTAG